MADQDGLYKSYEYSQEICDWTMGNERRVADFLEYADHYVGEMTPEKLREFCERRLLIHAYELGRLEARAMVAVAAALLGAAGEDAIRRLWLRAAGRSSIGDECGLSLADLERSLARREGQEAYNRLLRLNLHDRRSNRAVRELVTGEGIEDRRHGAAAIMGHLVADDRLESTGLSAALKVASLSRGDFGGVRGLDASIHAIGVLSPAAWSVLLERLILRRDLGEVASRIPRRCGIVGASKPFVCDEVRRIAGYAMRPLVRHKAATAAKLAWREAAQGGRPNG